MSQIKTLNGVQYTLPNYNDVGWGANTGNVLTQYMAAIADVTLQLTGGAFTLTAETDFGGNFGLKALYLKSETANPASAGNVRLAKTDSIKWRNNANGADIALAIDGSDNLQYNATKVLLSGAVVNADINAAAAIAYSKLALSNSIVNADINSAAAIAYSKLALSASIVNADVAAAAAIALTKLASTTAYYWYAANSSGVLTPLAVTASRAVATDSNGLPSASATTATELGYLSGVTSAIQTQLNTKTGGTNQPANLLINGGFDIWQRNTTFSAPATLAYTADRWQVNSDETTNVTVSKETTTVDTSAASMKVVVSSTGASHFYRIRQQIENALELAGKTVVVSVRVNTNVASAIKVAIGDQAAIQAESSYHSGGGGWETLSVSYTFASNITQATIFVGMIDAGDKKNGTYYFDNAMFCFGSTAVSFVPKTTSLEWADCQRYYFKTFDPATAPAQNTGISVGALAYSTIIAGANQNSTTLTYPVRMRTVPTITTFSIGAASSAWWNVSRGQASGAATVLFNSSTSCVSIRNAQAAGDVAGDAAGLHVTADAEM